MRGRIVAQSDAVVMTEHGRALRAARPIMTGTVVAGRKRSAVRLRAGQDIVPVWRIAAAIDDFPLFAKRGLLGQMIVAVQLVESAGDDVALGVAPGALADAVARIDAGTAVGRLRAQIGA